MAAPKIDRNLVLRIAELGCLSLSDAEIERFPGELQRIMAHVAQLDTLDTRDVPPTAHVTVDRAPLRADQVVAGLAREEGLAQAPEVDSDGFAVPAFLE
jgi:aspartyl-tRNA(Asn)/glutamyl-tRNA(Gln) amidotransferase subunit C